MVTSGHRRAELSSDSYLLTSLSSFGKRNQMHPVTFSECPLHECYWTLHNKENKDILSLPLSPSSLSQLTYSEVADMVLTFYMEYLI